MGHGSWVSPDPNLPGTHRPEGIIALAGAGLPPGRSIHARLIDATPTILDLLGLPIPAFIEGRPITGQPASDEAPSAVTATRHDPPQEPMDGPHRRPFD